MTEWLGWHFSSGRFGYRGGKRVENGRVIKSGKTYSATGRLRLCKNGMHASKRALDALQCAAGGIVSRVRLSGKIIEDTDKAVAIHRTVLWMADATQLLHEYACWCAEQALVRERAAGREPDPRSWAAIEAKRKWLHREINDEQLMAAWAAAWGAVRAAAGFVVWDAAGDAARDAAWEAALTAARAAVWGVSRAAARDAAWEAQNGELERRLMALAPSGYVEATP